MFPTLAAGSVFLNVEWTNQDGSTGSKVVGPYAVIEPDTTPPRIVSGTVANGEIKVAPGSINAGGFRYDFDEPVTGSIKLLDGSGIALNWIANVDARTARLTPFAGKKLLPESTYLLKLMFKMLLAIQAKYILSLLLILINNDKVKDIFMCLFFNMGCLRGKALCLWCFNLVLCYVFMPGAKSSGFFVSRIVPNLNLNLGPVDI